MRPGNNGLFVPEPTNLPHPLRFAMDLPLEDQRAPHFPAFTLGLFADLKRVFRIGHLGWLNELMLLQALAGAEMAMRDVGIPVAAGSGVAAAEEHYRLTAAPVALQQPAAASM